MEQQDTEEIKKFLLQFIFLCADDGKENSLN